MSFKLEHDRLNQYLMLFVIITTNFGQTIKVINISLSWIAIALLLISIIVQALSGNKRTLFLFKEKKVLLSMALMWIGISIFQGIWVFDYKIWYSGLLELFINIVLIVLLCCFINTMDDLLFMMKGVVISLFIQLGVGVWEVYSGNHIVNLGINYWDRDNVRTFMGNPNDCATWVLLCLLVMIMYLCFFNKRSGYLVIIPLSCWIIYKTGSRAGVLSLAIFGISFILSYLYVCFIDKNSRNKGIFIWGVFFISIIVIFLGAAFFNQLAEKYLGISGSSNYLSDVYRLKITSDTIGVIKEFTFLGAGAKQTTLLLGINPHNFILEILSDYGIIIFGFMLYILWTILRQVLNKALNKNERCFFISFVPALLVIGISSSSMNRLRMFWIVLVLVYLYSSLKYQYQCKTIEKVSS